MTPLERRRRECSFTFQARPDKTKACFRSEFHVIQITNEFAPLAL
jgi:hypothetical protein